MMMMNGVLLDHDNLSNLTCASNEDAISISSCGNRNEVGTMYPVPQISVAPPNQPPPPPKKKRNLPGNPDPEAEVVALSPKSLTATNRFLCEICNKGFQRDQNLQLHRRGHNLPWKLKQRANKDQVMKKKVYVCPEPTCVHHHPSRALGDLTGIKKHFYRKHGEKKWKCEKCSKRYAVQSDWKAHSKICGTREYRCDCGTLFSRRDSFITHRAFCDALAEESARATITPPSPLLSTTPNPHFNLHPFQLKRELQDHQLPQTSQFTLPPWLSTHTGPNPPIHDLSTQLFSPNPNPSHSPNPNPTTIDNNPFHEATFSVPPHMSATALLQKAAQMGVTMSKPHQANESGTVTSGTGLLFSTLSTSLQTAPTAGSGLVLPTREGRLGNPFGGKAGVTSGCMEQVGPTTGSPSFEMASLPSFEEAFGGMLNNQKMDGNFLGNVLLKPTHLGRGVEGGGGRSSGNDGLTRDFLGLRAFSHGGFPTMAGLDHINSSSSYDHQSQAPWEG